MAERLYFGKLKEVAEPPNLIEVQVNSYIEFLQKDVPASKRKNTGLQTVFREHSPRYYSLIEKFGQATGVPVVLNTSFNLKGEPIVNTPANAFSTFSRSGMDSLILEDFIIDKSV